MGNNQDKTSTSGSKRRLSRRDFVKYGGLALGAGAGLGSLGWTHDTTPEIPLSELRKQLTGIDAHGALITAAKIDPLLSYAGEYDVNGQTPAPVIEEGISDLLAAYIESEYQGAPASDLWEEIKQRIDYTYESLTPVLTPILGGLVSMPHGRTRMALTPTGRRVRREIVRNRRKLLFKPNLVTTEVLGFDGSGKAPQNQYGCPGQGMQACTDWSFLAALMRWFHDNLALSYYQMAFGEASPLLRMSCQMVAAAIPGFTPESLLEGRLSAFDAPDGGPGSPLYYGGYPFFFVRKYLSERHDPAHQDDPMQGHLESQQGAYVPPGAATHLLPAYNLSNAEAHTTDARGRIIAFPHGAQYTELTIHKAIVGDPDDPYNYPGCVLINVPKLKIHSIMAITNAIKNLGIGLWPTESGSDADPNTPDYKYSTPSTESFPDCAFPPMASLKARVYHTRQSHGLRFNCEGALDPSSVPATLNDGIKGTIVDLNLAVIGRTGCVPYTLHVCDAITVSNISHTGDASGYSKNEGLIFASEDPVALDLFCARYVYKSLPRGAVRGHPFAIYTSLGDVRFDSATGTIVSSRGGYEFPVENEPLYAYAEARGLGTQRYHVTGLDLTASGVHEALLASKNGHFGKLLFSKRPCPSHPFRFKELITSNDTIAGLPPHYIGMEALVWTLQNTMKRLTVAADQLTESTYGMASGYRDRLDAADLDQDGRLSFADDATDVENYYPFMGIVFNMMANGKMERSQFHATLKRIKYSEPAWNGLGAGSKTDLMPMTMAVTLASQPQSAETVDQFFGDNPYGRAPDGTTMWPSLQWARFLYEAGTIRGGYDWAQQYAFDLGYTFTLFLPDSLPYFPDATSPFMGLGLDEVEETDEQEDMFVVIFYDETGEEVERW